MHCGFEPDGVRDRREQQWTQFFGILGDFRGWLRLRLPLGMGFYQVQGRRGKHYHRVDWLQRWCLFCQPGLLLAAEHFPLLADHNFGRARLRRHHGHEYQPEHDLDHSHLRLLHFHCQLQYLLRAVASRFKSTRVVRSWGRYRDRALLFPLHGRLADHVDRRSRDPVLHPLALQKVRQSPQTGSAGGCRQV